MDLTHQLREAAKAAETILPKVFVYGTLKQGYGNWARLLHNERMLGVGEVEGILFHLGNFPALSLADKFGKVHGEVYEVPWEKLTQLDTLEGHPKFYFRQMINMSPYGRVWTYTFPYESAARQDRVIPSGRWNGIGTPTVKWLGFGKGVEVGSFQTSSVSPNEIRVGSGNTFILKKDELNKVYILCNRATGEALGTYRHLGDMMGKDGNVKPRLSLPMIVRESMPNSGHKEKPIVVPTAETSGAALEDVVITEGIEDDAPEPALRSLLGLKVRNA